MRDSHGRSFADRLLRQGGSLDRLFAFLLKPHQKKGLMLVGLIFGASSAFAFFLAHHTQVFSIFAGAVAVQNTGAASDARGGVSTISASWPSATTAGNLLVATVNVRGGSGTTITPPAGKGWTLAVRSDNASGVSTAIYYAANAASQSRASTWTISPAAHATVSLLEYEGVQTTGALNGYASASGSGTTATTGTIGQTGDAYEVVVASFAADAGNVNYGEQTSGFDEVNELASGKDKASERVSSTVVQAFTSNAASRSATASLSNRSAWAGAVAAFEIANALPVASIDSYTASTDGSELVLLTATFDDADGQDVKAKIEYEADAGGSCDGPWAPALLTGTPVASTNDSGGAPSISNANVYQLGSVAGQRIVTSGGENTMVFAWGAGTDLPGVSGTRCVRITPNDDLSDAASATHLVLVDTISPTAPASLSAADIGTTSTTVHWSPSTEDNFDAYELWYGTVQADVEARSGTALSWTDADDVNLASRATSSTSLSGLAASTTYYLRAWAKDAYGHEAASSTASVTTLAGNEAPSASVPTSIVQSTDGSGHVSFDTTIEDANLDASRLRVEYSEDDGITFYRAEILSAEPSSGEVALDNNADDQVDSIETDSGAITLSLVWDTQSASNQNGSLTGLSLENVRVRVIPSDEEDTGAAATSARFSVDNEPPQISALSLSPGTGTLHVGDELGVLVVSDAVGYRVERCQINGVDVADTFVDAGGGSYTFAYTVSAEDASQASGEIPVDCSLTDVFGNISNFISFTDANTAAIDTSVQIQESEKGNGNDDKGNDKGNRKGNRSENGKAKGKNRKNAGAGASEDPTPPPDLGPDPAADPEPEPAPEPDPIVLTATVTPWAGVSKIGDEVSVFFSEESGVTDLILVECLVNGVDVSGTFENFEDATYGVVYEVAEGDNDWVSGSLALNCTFAHAEESYQVTTFSDGNSLSGDGHSPDGLTEFHVSKTSKNSATLKWSPAFDANFDYYQIWYAEAEDAVAQRTDAASSWTTELDSSLSLMESRVTDVLGLKPSTEYFFGIAAFDVAGNELTLPLIHAMTKTSGNEQPVVTCDSIKKIQIRLNAGASKTESQTVTVEMRQEGAKQVMLSEDPSFVGGVYQPVEDALAFTLSNGYGVKIIYAKFKNDCRETEAVSDKIKYVEPPKQKVVQVVETAAAVNSAVEYVGQAASANTAAAPKVSTGDLIKSDAQVFYLGTDARRHPFADAATFLSWFSADAKVTVVSAEEMRKYPIGKTVTIRPGSQLLQVEGSQEVSVVSPGGVLHAVEDAAILNKMYGSKWAKFVTTISTKTLGAYQVGLPIERAAEYDPENVYQFASSIEIDLSPGDFDAASANISKTRLKKPLEAVEANQVLQVRGISVTESGTECTLAKPISAFMNVGTVGYQVIELKLLMRCLGFYNHDGEPSFRFDGQTRNSLMHLQEQFGIEANGVIDAETRRVLNQYVE